MHNYMSLSRNVVRPGLGPGWALSVTDAALGGVSLDLACFDFAESAPPARNTND